MAQGDGLYLITFKKFLKSRGGGTFLFCRRKCSVCLGEGRARTGAHTPVATDALQQRCGDCGDSVHTSVMPFVPSALAASRWGLQAQKHLVLIFLNLAGHFPMFFLITLAH